jgi:hypothetical protein
MIERDDFEDVIVWVLIAMIAVGALIFIYS